MKTALTASIAAAGALLLTASSGQAQLAYAIADASTLIRFDVSNPFATTTTIGLFSGATNRLDGLDFRPADGKLYGYDGANNRIVTVDVATGATVFVSTPSTASSTPVLGIDFNPTVDRLRVVNGNDQNLRVNVDTGATLVDGPLAYAAGDPNFGVNPNIIEAAYTNSDTNGATGTQLYYIDIGTDTLVTTSAPNAGTLTTVGSLGINTGGQTGFDILSDGLGGNIFYAVLAANAAAQSQLYTINAATGAATLVGAVNDTNVWGLAIVQGPVGTPIPEPGSALVGAMVLGVCGLGGARRRRGDAMSNV